MYPAKVRADGDCLPHAGSVFAFGNEHSQEEMRSRIVLELVNYEQFYLSQDFLIRGLPSMKIPQNLAGNFVQYSEQFIPGVPLSSESIKTVYRHETLSIRNPRKYMGIWQLFALSSVLGMKIFSVYPKLGNPSVRQDLHRLIVPRCACTNDATVQIMWTSTRTSDMNKKHWVPNHFVPVLPEMLPPQTNLHQPSSTATDLVNEIPDVAPSATVPLNDIPTAEASSTVPLNIPIAAPSSTVPLEEMPDAAPSSSVSMNEIPDVAPCAAVPLNDMPDAAPNSSVPMNIPAPSSTVPLTNIPDAAPSLTVPFNDMPDAAPSSTVPLSKIPDVAPSVTDSLNNMPVAVPSATVPLNEIPDVAPSAADSLNDMPDAASSATVPLNDDLPLTLDSFYQQSSNGNGTGLPGIGSDLIAENDFKKASTFEDLNKNLPLPDALVGEHVIVLYEGNAYPGKVLDVDEQHELYVECMHHVGKESNWFFWPRMKDRCWYDYDSSVLALIPKPSGSNNSRHKNVDPDIWKLIVEELEQRNSDHTP